MCDEGAVMAEDACEWNLRHSMGSHMFAESPMPIVSTDAEELIRPVVPCYKPKTRLCMKSVRMLRIEKIIWK